MSVEIDFSNIEEEFTNDFMKNYTQFNTFEDMIDSSDFQVENQEDFEAIPDAEWDIFISQHTNFENWEDMMSQAGEVYVANHLHF